MTRHYPRISRYFFLVSVSLACLAGCDVKDNQNAQVADSEGSGSKMSDALDETIERANAVGASLGAAVSDVVGEAQTAVDKLRPTELAQEKLGRAQEEYGKLHAFEYHVESVFLPTTAPDLQLRLNELGKDKWECGGPIIGLTASGLAVPTAVIDKDSQRAPEPLALIVCKRRPATYLRMINKFAP